MANRDDEFLQKLLATFRVEAGEHLQAMSAGLLELEHRPPAERHAEVIETVFREAHTLKGAARAVNLREIETVCQSLENVFAALKAGRSTVPTTLYDLLQQAIGELGAVLSVEGEGMAAGAGEMIGSLARRLDDALRSQPVPPVPAAVPQPVPRVESVKTGKEAPAAHSSVADPSLVAGTVRVSAHKLDMVMRQVEELLMPRLAATQRAAEMREFAASFGGRKKQWERIRPALRTVERYVEKENSGTETRALRAPELTRLLEHLEGDHQFLKTLEQQLLRASALAAQDGRMLAGMADGLLDEVRELHQLPFASLIETFPRFIRELSHEQGKQVELTVRGSEIEIDRRILEEMKAPMLHLLRNCLDHGIELPAVRAEKGKPAQGTIAIDIAQYDSGRITIAVSDDGAGMDAAKLKSAALKMELVSAAEAEKLGEQEALALAFRSGISTSQTITDISGRGLGLAIVREKVERMGGDVALESGIGRGTTFRITLPLTLATMRGVLVRAGDQRFVIPALGVERVARVPRQDIRTVENRATIELGGEAVALASLGDVLELPAQNPAADATEKVQVAVLGSGSQHIAFMVDEVVGELAVLVKPLGKQLARVRNVSGASVLGSGRVVATLNVSDLLKSAMRRGAPAPAAAKTGVPPRRRSVLLAEDSITSRALLKNILESASYLVTTAVDGLDAYGLLKNGKFDLVVSDVEMPRMDGFDLTARVRADKQLAGLPVVLLTGLESSEHRERGFDVGANAYIVKSSFDQSNLLEVIRRLI